MLAGSMKLGSGMVRGLGHIHGVGWDSHGISSERNWKPHCSLNAQQRHKWGICRFQSHWASQNLCICRSLCFSLPGELLFIPQNTTWLNPSSRKLLTHTSFLSFAWPRKCPQPSSYLLIPTSFLPGLPDS